MNVKATAYRVTFRGVPILVRVLPHSEYRVALLAFLRERRLPWWNQWARAFIRPAPPGGQDRWVLHVRVDAALDERLLAHEAGHAIGLPHPAEWPSPRLLFDVLTWTIMHPAGWFRRRDPDGLLVDWHRACRDAIPVPAQ